MRTSQSAPTLPRHWKGATRGAGDSDHWCWGEFFGSSTRCALGPNGAEIPPSGVDLSRFLAEDAAFPSADDRDDLAKVSSFYEAFQRRMTLRARLRDILYSKGRDIFQTGPLYQFLADITAPLLIISTNYDTQVEQAFRNAGRAYDLVIDRRPSEKISQTLCYGGPTAQRNQRQNHPTNWISTFRPRPSYSTSTARSFRKMTVAQPVGQFCHY